MKFQSFYSSSKSNLYTVTAANGKRILVECGCTWKQLLKAIDYDLLNIVGCLLTHEHRDHSRCIEDVLAAGIDVYASYGTFDSLGIDPIGTRHIKVIHDRDRLFITGSFNVLPFVVNHDAVEPMGFVIVSPFVDNERLLFVTDTSHIKQKFGLAFNIIALCCNYDGEILHELEEEGKINTELAKRLLDSHMEWHVTKDYIKDFCCLDNCYEIHLLHMSRSNIDGEAVRAEFEKDFMVKTLIAGSKK